MSEAEACISETSVIFPLSYHLSFIVSQKVSESKIYKTIVGYI